MASDTSAKNARVATACAVAVVGMVGLSFAAVPLYRWFCQVTGFGGTTQVAEAAPEVAKERTIRVRFNADVNPRLPWAFRPQTREVTVRIGEPGLVFYEARNDAARPTVGTATYNVTPLKAGKYFHKVQCFCFEEQKLAPGESIEMGVSFFVDPAIMEDPNLDDVKDIVLSYTFFRDLDDWESEQEAGEVSSLGAPRGAHAQLANSN